MKGKFKVVAAAALAACAVATGLTVTTTASAATGSTPFNLADPDTVRGLNGRYVTYGTTANPAVRYRCPGAPSGTLKIPFLVHGSGSTVGMANCVTGDALPGGPGSWADGSKGIWAPGVVRYGDKYFMYFTALRAGSGQRCIGRAVSNWAQGPFVNAREWACPPAGRWAIDADPFVTNGRMYVAYRDDYITSGAETGLSVVRTNSNGFAEWSTRRDLLKSTDITWDTLKNNQRTHIVENPSMFKHGNYWYVMYSGNSWHSVRYSTGIARCGTGPLPGSRCRPIGDGVKRPYFGWVDKDLSNGDQDLNPVRGLPSNHTGPGGMSVFHAADGTARVVWHWWRSSDRTRHVKAGSLRYLSSNRSFYVA